MRNNLGRGLGGKNRAREILFLHVLSLGIQKGDAVLDGPFV